MAWCARRGSLPARLALVFGVLLLQACEQREVTTVDAASVELSPPAATVSVQSSVRLSATVLSNGGAPLSGRRVEWISLNPDIAVVEDDGTVRGVAPGTATIQAVSEGVTGTATVTVTSGPIISVTPTEVAFVGAQNGASPGDRTVSVSNAGGGSLGSLTASVRYVTGTAGWLSASLSSPAAPASLVLSASQGALPAGTYTAAVDVASPDADGPPATVNVTLNVVGPQPAISLGVTSVSFAAAQGGANPQQQSVGVTNAGGGTLSGLAAAVEYTAGQPTGWLTTNLTAATAPTSLVLNAATGSLPAGTYTATVRVSSAAAQNSPQSLSVSFTIGAALPIIGTEPGELVFSAQIGDVPPASQTVQITNTGGGSLTGLNVTVAYPGGQPGGWLVTSLSGTTAPATLTVNAVTGALPAGSYTAAVQIASAAAANSPQSVEVTFNVTAAPSAIGLSASTAQFSAASTGSNPAPVVINVANAGGGTLSGLSTAVSYPAGQPTGWLSAALGATTAPTTLTLTAARGSLGTGTHTATVSVSSPTAGNSPVNVAVTFTITEGTPTIPAAPGSLTATAISDRRIDLTWSDNSTNEERFDIERSTNAGASWTPLTPAAAGQTSFTDETGLAGSTAYSYRVSACNAGGCSAPSPTAAATTAPETPTAVAATAVSPTQIDVSWSDNSPDETGFKVERSVGDTQTWTEVHTAAANATAYSDMGLTPGTTYRYRIQACRTATCSRLSTVASATTGAAPPAPSAPTGLTATAQSTSRIDLAWTAAVGTLDQYRVERKSGAGEYAVVATLDGSTVTFQNTGLTAGTEYTYRVQACNQGSCSDYSAEASATTNAVLAPAAPTNVTATGVSTSRIDVTWDHSGNGVAFFQIQRAPDSNPTAFAALTSPGAGDRSYSDTLLPASTTFHYRVRACNLLLLCSGWATASGTTFAEAGSPAIPSGVSASAVSPTEVVVGWTPPGGQTHYEIRRRTGTGGPWTFTDDIEGIATEYADAGLSPNTTYQYQVRACAASCSQFSSQVTVATLPDGSVGSVIHEPGAGSGAYANLTLSVARRD